MTHSTIWLTIPAGTLYTFQAFLSSPYSFWFSSLCSLPRLSASSCLLSVQANMTTVHSLLELFYLGSQPFRCSDCSPLLSSLCCRVLGYLQAYMHAVCFRLLELSLLALLTFPTLWLQVPATVFSVLLVLCHVQADMRTVCFLPELFFSLDLLSMFIVLVALCWACATIKTLQLNHVSLLPHVPIMFHPVRQTHGQTNFR